MVPRFCWLDLALAASLYRMYGVPVSIWLRSISNHRSWAGTVLVARPSASYLSYSAAYSSPHESASPGHLAGSNRDQVPPDSTRRMNRSDTQTA